MFGFLDNFDIFNQNKKPTKTPPPAPVSAPPPASATAPVSATAPTNFLGEWLEVASDLFGKKPVLSPANLTAQPPKLPSQVSTAIKDPGYPSQYTSFLGVMRRDTKADQSKREASRQSSQQKSDSVIKAQPESGRYPVIKKQEPEQIKKGQGADVAKQAASKIGEEFRKIKELLEKQRANFYDNSGNSRVDSIDSDKSTTSQSDPARQVNPHRIIPENRGTSTISQSDQARQVKPHRVIWYDKKILNNASQDYSFLMVAFDKEGKPITKSNPRPDEIDYFETSIYSNNRYHTGIEIANVGKIISYPDKERRIFYQKKYESGNTDYNRYYVVKEGARTENDPTLTRYFGPNPHQVKFNSNNNPLITFSQSPEAIFRNIQDNQLRFMGQKTPNEIKQEAENKMEAERIREEEYRRIQALAKWRGDEPNRAKDEIKRIEANIRAKQPGAIRAKKIRAEERHDELANQLLETYLNEKLPDYQRQEALQAFSDRNNRPSTSPKTNRVVTGFDVHSMRREDYGGARKKVVELLANQPPPDLVAHEYKGSPNKTREKNGGSSR